MKFNGFENYLLTRGLELVKAEMIAEIESTPEGKNHLMTVGFVEMTCEETLKNLDSNTNKKDLKNRSNK
jgi:hypothetical protein